MAALAAFRAGVVAALACLVALTALPEPVEAQNLPGGSWRQTCRNAVMHGRDELRADCQRRNGTWNKTGIDIDRCGRGGTLANIDGNLVCENQGVHGGNNQNLPSGSWRLTCRNAQMLPGNRLRADCQRRDGGWSNATIDVDRCGRAGIANINGDLQCEGHGGGQAGGGHGGGWWGQGLPPGSYRQSCRNERMESRDDLVAECRRANGGYRYTKLDIDKCRGRDIVNDNGHLECGGQRYGGNYGRYQMPGGTWQQTCRNARIVRDDLFAECRQRDGDWVNSSLDLDDCRGQQVHNDNGRLRCGGGNFGGGGGNFGGGNYGGGNLPHGPWQETCRNAYFEPNGRMVAQCRQYDGDWKTDGINVPGCHGRPIRKWDPLESTCRHASLSIL